MPVADPGEGPGGPAPLLFLDQNEAEKKFFLSPPPLISGCGWVYLPLRPGAILSVTTEFGDHHDKSASNWGQNTVEPRYNEGEGTDKIWFAITRVRYIRVYNGLLVRSKSFFIYFTITGQWRVQGRGLGGPAPPPLIFRPNWGPKGSKKFFWRPGPPFLRVWWLPLSPPLIWRSESATSGKRKNRSLDRGSTQQRAFHHFLNATRKNQNNSRPERSCT